MEIDSNLLKEFAKITNDSETTIETKYLRGTIVSNSGGKYVQLDGSTTVTPISEIVDVEEGDRVLVTIENHKATIVGNFTFPPSARKEQEAIDKADSAQSTANQADTTANAAQLKAQEASEKADTAISQSSIASASADEAKEQAADAIAKAESAQENVSEAKELATQASADATEAKNQAAASQASSAEAQAEVTRLQGEVDAAKEDVAEALEELETQAGEITVIKETYSTKVEVENTKAELETTITTKVGELETTISETYSTKTENVELEGRLQTQITQNAEGLTSQVTKIEQIEADTTQAQQDVADALAKASAAQTAADSAQANASAAQDAADAASADAASAAEKATIAQNAADAAQTAADAADKAIQEAQGDLDEAKQNLESVTSRIDATEAEIAEAQSKVDAAQTAVNEALADAAEANLAATKAQEAADQAQADAETAQGVAATAQQKADNAQTAADNAQAAAEQAQADVAALTSRVTTAETTITQNTEKIELNASKTEEIGTKLDNLQVGGRNLALKTNQGVTNWGYASQDGTISIDKYTDETDDIQGVKLTCYTASTNWQYIYYELGNTQLALLKENTNYILSCDIKSSIGNRNINLSLRKNNDTNLMSTVGTYTIKGDETWEKLIIPITTIEDFSTITVDSQVLYFTGVNKVGYVIIKNLKFEEGNIPTTWTPAPEDVDEDIDAVKTDLANNYYTKTETDAKIQVESDRITSTVSRVETVEKTASDALTAADNAQDDIDNLEVGGRNLYLNSKTMENGSDYWNGLDNWVQSEDLYNDFVVYTKDTSWNGFAPYIETKKGDVYTLSFYGKVDAGGSIYCVHRNIAIGNVMTGLEIIGGNFSSGILWVDEDDDGSEWKRYWASLEVTEDDVTLQWRVENKYDVGTLSLCGFKLERGNKPTDWTPAPEDIDADIDDAQNAAENAQTTADTANTSVTEAHSLIQQLSDMIANLVTDENGTSLMTQTSEGWTFNMSTISGNLTTIEEAMNNMSDEHSETNDALTKLTNLVNEVVNKTAYINIGTDDNGDPCIELGKTDNDFKVRITNTAIDFLEGSTKIAYANNNTFYAEKMIVKNELQIGEGPGFVWRTRANGNMGLVYISG